MGGIHCCTYNVQGLSRCQQEQIVDTDAVDKPNKVPEVQESKMAVSAEPLGKPFTNQL